MINTLRITSIIAAILAGIFFVFPVVFGVRSDESLEKFLNSPGVIEKFNSAAGDKARQGGSRVSPLVQQAEAFGLYLNPPKPQIAKTQAEQKTTITQDMPVTPKFTVLGTCFYNGRPEMSLALIDEPGKGLHWVRQSSKVGHLLIEEVKDGLVVVKGSKGTFERPVEQKPKTNLPKGAAPVSAGPRSQSRLRSSSPPLRSSSPPLGRVPAGVSSTRSKPPSRPQRSAEETAKLEELVGKLKNLQRSSTSDKTSSGPSEKEKAALVEKLISNFKSTRISDEEAKKLDNLGKNLKDIREDPNRSGPTTNKDKVEAEPGKPD
ncbi:MAG: hypothetical protein ACYTFW_12385 [Planctomycetota bacterium]|jgi:hypothetical protein